MSTRCSRRRPPERPFSSSEHVETPALRRVFRWAGPSSRSLGVERIGFNFSMHYDWPVPFPNGNHHDPRQRPCPPHDRLHRAVRHATSWLPGNGRACEQVCQGAGRRPVQSGVYLANGQMFNICAANTAGEGLRPVSTCAPVGRMSASRPGDPAPARPVASGNTNASASKALSLRLDRLQPPAKAPGSFVGPMVRVRSGGRRNHRPSWPDLSRPSTNAQGPWSSRGCPGRA